ncbi:hypothetical protein PG996_006862 [Apiospora saccharicola]|uniref:Pea pathogenicity protein n=1 Tax=Apiospora saccharicola TaxID=335842 RepID=A0ABR1V964_9PEZI
MASVEDVIPKIRKELCDDSLRSRIPAWGPAPKSEEGLGFTRSWTDAVSKTIGSTRHYITCDGSLNDQHQCLGRWS